MVGAGFERVEGFVAILYSSAQKGRARSPLNLIMDERYSVYGRNEGVA
jgi:hypothetical protein